MIKFGRLEILNVDDSIGRPAWPKLNSGGRLKGITFALCQIVYYSWVSNLVKAMLLSSLWQEINKTALILQIFHTGSVRAIYCRQREATISLSQQEEKYP